MDLQNFLAAIAVVINGLPQGLLALTFGFAAFPTALAFLVGCGGMLFFGQVAPISFQAESIVMAGTMGCDREERLNIVFYTGIAMSVIGGIGLLQPTIDFIGPAILNGMMAGVGITLAKVGVDMTKEDVKVGAVSVFCAVVTYFISKNLVYTIVISVFISTFASFFLTKKKFIGNADEKVSERLTYERLIVLKLKCNYNIVRSVLAMITLQIGGNIAYASITGNLAKTATNVDYVTLYSGIGDAISAFFGGGPVEAIISGTAVAPDPIVAGAAMMLIMAAILFAKLLPKIAKYVPSQTIAGFLLVLGAIVVFPVNIEAGFAEGSVTTSVTAIVTATTDPFLGMLAGIAVRYLSLVF
ncbi:xanthine/uracil permease [Synergistales bacterium]|nr:xanthine/uracil permease [Synergistales bacterium]